jgi:dTDP-4-dehydrorhamnose 3,5-epimerase
VSRFSGAALGKVLGVRFRKTDLEGVYLVELEPQRDERGFFARAYADEEFAAHGLPTHYPHLNISRNDRAGTLRGMHYNAAPASECKLVRCVSGRIWDVVADLRRGSPTRFQSVAVELTAERGEAIFVPEGFAHGFITMTDGADVLYHMGRVYEPGAARGIRWNDPRLAITWPREPAVMSARDRGYPDYDDATFDG